MRKLTIERLREALSYDPETGQFVWLFKINRKITPGDVAGTINSKGYRYIAIDSERCPAHRLAYFYMTGEKPNAFIDHANGSPSDNRFCNLRLATQSENLANKRRGSNNTSGFKGVSRKRDKWRATITCGGKFRALGVFPTPEEAHAAYVVAATRVFGDFARAS